MTVEIDKAGRIVVPKKLRDAMHLVPGTKLRLARSGNTFIAEPEIPPTRLVIENGVPLIYPATGFEDFHSDPDSIVTLIDKVRADRDRHNTGLYDDEIEG